MAERDRELERWRALARGLALLSGLLVVVVLIVLVRDSRKVPAPPLPVEEDEPKLVLEPAAFTDLSGWDEDDLAGFGLAFGRSCDVFARRPAETPLSRSGLGGTAGDWSQVCDRVSDAGGDPAALRGVLAQELRPWSVRDRDSAEGLFTGYYEPTLQGSRHRSERYKVPLYRRPSELLTVDLGSFREDLRGRRVAGRVEGTRLVPFADRAAVDGGALEGRGLELVWVSDPVDAFFLHIQGSGRVELEGSGFLRVGYAGQNGHPYYAIGRELVAREQLALEDVSMQSIRAWLADHPEEATEVMQRNASFVFFRELEGEGPVGSQGVALTPERSLALDRTFYPLGLPVWLDTAPSTEEAEGPDLAVQRLVVAQDSGGAIRGPVRGDLFWGHGESAASIAGHMRHSGRMWILLPRHLEPPDEVRG